MRSIPATPKLCPPSRRTLFSGVISAAALGVAPALARPDPDTELITLGKTLWMLWEKEDAAYDDGILDGGPAYRTAFSEARGIAERILALTATSFAGLRAKAIAVAWSIGEREPSPKEFGETLDMSVIASIIRDLLGHERPDMERLA